MREMSRKWIWHTWQSHVWGCSIKSKTHFTIVTLLINVLWKWHKVGMWSSLPLLIVFILRIRMTREGWSHIIPELFIRRLSRFFMVLWIRRWLLAFGSLSGVILTLLIKSKG